jgi:hypothetical protein
LLSVTASVLTPVLPAAEATKPEDWDDEEDGDWEPPRVPNPKCKEAPGCGEWKRPTKQVRQLQLSFANPSNLVSFDMNLVLNSPATLGQLAMRQGIPPAWS